MLPAKLRFSLLATLAFWFVASANGQMLGDITDATLSLSAGRVETTAKRARHTHTSGPISGPFTGMAVEAATSDESLTAEVRFERAGGWSEWLPMRIVRSAVGDGLVAGYRSDSLLQASAFEVRFDIGSESKIIVRGAGTFDGTLDSDSDSGSDSDSEPLGFQPVFGAISGNVIPPGLITRDDWGARPFIRGNPIPLSFGPLETMTFHHAAGFSATTRQEGEQQVRAIQDLHQDVRGWSDIGYHFVIDRGGRLYQGRPFLTDATRLVQLPVFARGAHVGGANTGNIGICILGCYHPPEGAHCTEELTAAARQTYVTLFAFLSERYGIPVSRIKGHRDQSNTACPGDNNYALLPGIRTSVSNLLVTGNQAIAQGTLESDVNENGVVSLFWSFSADFGILGVRLEKSIGAESIVLHEAVGGSDGSFVDDLVVSTEPVSYRLYVTGDGGLEQQVASTEVILTLPSTATISEVFPNPTLATVRFRYFIQNRGRVSLDVYDAVGRSVAGVVDRIQDGESWYSVPFDASTLPAGVYFYRVRVEGFSGLTFDVTKPLVVTR